MVAFEEELLFRIKQQGLNIKPQILVVSSMTLERLFSVDDIINLVNLFSALFLYR